MTRLVLGSASPGRLKVLRQAGLDPLVVVSGVDEDAVVAKLGPDADAIEVTIALATAKAHRVVGLLEPGISSDCVVVGCDSMLEVGSRLVGKPGSADVARSQWHSMGGRSGRLHTGHCLLRLHRGAVAEHAKPNQPLRQCISPNQPPQTWMRTSPAANRCTWQADSRSMDWVAGSSTGSRATRRM